MYDYIWISETIRAGGESVYYLDSTQNNIMFMVMIGAAGPAALFHSRHDNIRKYARPETTCRRTWSTLEGKISFPSK